MANNTQQHLIHEALKSWLDSLVEYLSMLDTLTQPGRLNTDALMLYPYTALRDDLALVIYDFTSERDVAGIDWPSFQTAVARCFETNREAVQASVLSDSEALTTYNECRPELVAQALAGSGLHFRLVSQSSSPVEPSTDDDGPF